MTKPLPQAVQDAVDAYELAQATQTGPLRDERAHAMDEALSKLTVEEMELFGKAMGSSAR